MILELVHYLALTKLFVKSSDIITKRSNFSEKQKYYLIPTPNSH